VRLDPEMNGWWEGPFSEANRDGTPQNGNRPGQFVQAWRHIVELVRAQGAGNVAWYWCANVVAADPSSLSPLNPSRLGSFYPGDDVVDFVGTDVFNPAAAAGAEWLSFEQCLRGDGSSRGDTWSSITHIAPSKPWLLGEVGCHDAPGDKPAWIVDMFEQIPRQFPRIAGLCWFNWDAQGRYLLSQPRAAMAAWGAGARAAAYLKAGSFPLPRRVEDLWHGLPSLDWSTS
jgi:mannan endo-1,4-beta-mannosidase